MKTTGIKSLRTWSLPRDQHENFIVSYQTWFFRTALSLVTSGTKRDVFRLAPKLFLLFGVLVSAATLRAQPVSQLVLGLQMSQGYATLSIDGAIGTEFQIQFR